MGLQQRLVLMPGGRSRLQRTLGKKVRQLDYHEEDYRYPPKPDSYYDVKEKGMCRWCGNLINNERGERNMRASWHPECSEEYRMIYDTTYVRKYIRQRDYAECNWCGEYDPRFHVDHIRPLYEQKGLSNSEIDLSYWDERNLQTLCRKCHKEKTKEDMKRLREIKNEQKEKV